MQNVRAVQALGIPEELFIGDVIRLLVEARRSYVGPDVDSKIFALGPVKVKDSRGQVHCRDNTSYVYLQFYDGRTTMSYLFYDDGAWEAYDWDLIDAVIADYKRRDTWEEFNTMFRAALYKLDENPWIISKVDLISHLNLLQRIA